MKRTRRPLYWTAEFYEYAFTPVPMEQRKSTPRVFIVTAGYTVALSCFVIGAKVGHALPFWQAVGACVAGNIILMVIGTLMGIMGFDTGWSTAFLVRQKFGKLASAISSGAIIFLCIYWVGLNGDSFARMIVTAFPQWKIPVAITAVLLVVLWGLTAAYGWRGLERISWLFVPGAVALVVAGMYQITTRVDCVDALAGFVPSGKMTLTAAIAAISGNYIFGCIISPDLCRFAKSRKAVAQTIIPAHMIGFVLLNICGVLVAQSANTGDFSVGVSRLGLALPFLLCAILGLWTTENNNIYGGSLAAQCLFKGTAVEGNLSHNMVSWMIAGVSAAFAAIRALNYLMPIVTVISVLVPPVAGMLCVEHFIIGRVHGKSEGMPIRWSWIPAWALGAAAGIWAFSENFLIPPVMAMFIAGLVYYFVWRVTRPREPKERRGGS